jgi:biotin carboxylase
VHTQISVFQLLSLSAFPLFSVSVFQYFSISAFPLLMTSLLVLGAGPLQLPAILTAKRLGLRVVALDGDAHAPGLALADVAHVVNILDADACLAVARSERPDGVLHLCSEVAMPAVGAINDDLGLHGPGRRVVAQATNKERMRRAFEAAGAPSPISYGAQTVAQALAAAAKLTGPLIIKPSRNSGSRGVTRLDPSTNEDALLRAFRLAVQESRDHSAVIEQFIEGPEFSVEILVWEGQARVLAITDKQTTGAPAYVETGHCQPSRFTVAEQEAVQAAALAGVKALGIDWSAAHAEVRLSENGPFLIEIGARLGGDFITTELVPRSTGIDMVEGAIQLALGQRPALPRLHPPRGAAIRYLTPAPGTVREIRGLETAKRIPGVQIVEVSVAPGEVVPPITSSLARVGHVICEGATADAAVDAAERARDTIQIITDAPAAPNAQGQRSPSAR